MKKIMSNNRILALLFFTVFSAAAVQTTFASDKTPAIPVALKYLGNVRNQPMFQLDFNGTAAQNEFTILITDAGGNTLYRENIRGEKFSKKFLLNTDELGEDQLNFTIYCRNTKGSVQYSVNRHTRTLQEVVVKEAN